MFLANAGFYVPRVIILAIAYALKCAGRRITMKRVLLSSIAGILILPCCAILLAQIANATYSQPSSTQRTKDSGREDVKTSATSSSKDAPTITIVFKGLMVFHFDPEKLQYEVGVLRAPDHQLRIHVEKKSPSGTSEILVPV